MNQSLDFPLSEDELGHIQAISERLNKKLSHVDSGTSIATDGLATLNDILDFSEPKGMVSLLVAKSTQNVRFAVRGLTLGYYSGAITELRSSLEALQYATLFGAKRTSLAQWVGLQLRREEYAEAPPLAWRREADALRRETKRVWTESERNHILYKGLGVPLKLLITDDGNLNTHITWKGLADQFGIELRDLIPETLNAKLLGAGDDLEESLELHLAMEKLKSNPSAGPLRQSPEKDKPFIEGILEFMGRYDEGILSDYSTFALYLAHRALDLVESELDIPDPFVQRFYEWRQAVPGFFGS